MKAIGSSFVHISALFFGYLGLFLALIVI